MEADCKSVAKATQVRILHLPPPAQRASDQRKRRIWGPSLCPTVNGLQGLFAAVRAEYVSKLWAAGLPQRLLDSTAGDDVLAVETLGVDAQQHLDTVAGPLSHLRWRDAGVEPGRDPRMPQVAGTPCQWRGNLLRRQGGLAGTVPRPVDAPHRHGVQVGQRERDPRATGAAHEQPAISPRAEDVDVTPQMVNKLGVSRDPPGVSSRPMQWSPAEWCTTDLSERVPAT
jgi:hypothetical protein